MSSRIVLAGLLASSIVLAACGKGDKETADRPDATGGGAAASDASGMPTEAQLQAQADATRKSLAQANGGKEIKAVELKDLKAVLPESVGAAKRSNTQAQRVSQMGVDMSTAEADYDSEPDGSENLKPGFNIEITDLGNMSGTMLNGYAMWAMTQFERETDTGYEKTTKYKGYPAMEKYDREGKSGEIDVFVGRRFVLKVNGHDATIEQIRGAADAVDVAKLDSMAK